MNELVMQENISVLFAQKKIEIKELFAPELSEIQFDYFMQMAIKTGVNPFLREIFAVKTRYRNKEDKWVESLSVFCGRDFYRRVAQAQHSYNGHISSAIYKNDTLTINNGAVNHLSNLANRGELIGAYCTVYRKDLVAPITVFVNFKEYAKTFGTWLTMPATMIDKVAESQGFRKAYQGLFSGTNDESEQWQVAVVAPEQPKKIIKNDLSNENLSLMIEHLNKAQKDLDLEITSIETRNAAELLVSKIVKRVTNYNLTTKQRLQILSAITFEDLRNDLETYFIGNLIT